MFSDYFKKPDYTGTVEEKINLIRENYLRAKNVLALIAESKEQHLIEETVDLPPKKEVLEKEDNELEELYNKISMVDIKGLDDEEVSLLFQKIIPTNISIDSLSKLKVKLFQDIIIYYQMSITATQEELLDIKMQIADLRNKIRSLDVEMEEKEVVQNATTNNDVFFLQSEMGKVYFLESLRKNIPEAYYPDFKKLLESIKNGTFIGKKYLIDLNYFELKEFKVRLTFDKLSDGNYIVIDGFMKKEDTSSKYKNYMRQMDKVYCSRQNFYIENHLNPDFLATHTTYYQDIIDMLDKPQGLKRGGEENA